MSATDKVQSALLASLAAVAGSSALPGEKGLFTLTRGQDRRARTQEIHDRTGWAFAECRRLVDTKSDAEIEAIVREHEAQKARAT